MRLIEKQTECAGKNANQRQCTPQSGISASLFSMPDLVKPLDTLLSETGRQNIMSDNAVEQSLTVRLSVRLQDTADVIQCRYNVRVQEQGTGDREDRGIWEIQT